MRIWLDVNLWEYPWILLELSFFKKSFSSGWNRINLFESGFPRTAHCYHRGKPRLWRATTRKGAGRLDKNNEIAPSSHVQMSALLDRMTSAERAQTVILSSYRPDDLGIPVNFLASYGSSICAWYRGRAKPGVARQLKQTSSQVLTGGSGWPIQLPQSSLDYLSTSVVSSLLV